MDTKETLFTGSLAEVREVTAADEQALECFYRNLSWESRALRFHGAMSATSLDAFAHDHCRTDERTFGVISIEGEDERVTGHALFAVVAPGLAEIAFAVADGNRSQGLASLMLTHLADAAIERGIHTFIATVQPYNYAMISVFRESGFAVNTRAAAGELEVRMLTERSPEAGDRSYERDWTGAVHAVSALLRPRSIAVIGASRERGTIGGETLHNVLSNGFTGPIYPVNPSAEAVHGVKAYPTVQDIPGTVDLGIIVVPAKRVVEVARECASKGVKSIVVISAGFGESDDDGRAEQQKLVDLCRRSGMRLVGPNCMGVLNTDPAVSMNATFGPVVPRAGRIAIMSQSGALGLALMGEAKALELGISSFISVGNKADISGNDLLRYWHDDAGTDVILLYLESFGNPRRFARIARDVARRKPIIAVKSGRYTAGARATSSHTGALVGSSDVPVDALLKHAGVIRTDTLAEMFDVAALLACQKPPRGRRVAILTNAGGPAILCADACESKGLEVPELAPETRSALAAILPKAASTVNPVDMIASATTEQFREAVRILLRDPDIDALIVIFIPPLSTRADDVADAIMSSVEADNGGKTVLTVFMQCHGLPPALQSANVRLPSYAFPENAAIALARAAEYAEWLTEPQVQSIRIADVRTDEAASIVARALGQSEWLSPSDAVAVLNCYGIPAVTQELVDSPLEAERAARATGTSVVLKGVADGLVHRSDEGAVRLDLHDNDVRLAADEMKKHLETRGYTGIRFLVQPMIDAGLEMIVGVVQDDRFGPIIACGAGGTAVELLKDVSVRLAPLAASDAAGMLRELRIFPLFEGYRGAPVRDVGNVTDLLLRVSQLAEDIPQIMELDLNPVIVQAHSVTVVDARIRLRKTGANVGGSPTRRP